MKTVVLFDPSLGGLNLGDEIIVDAIEKELHSCLGPCRIVRLSMHQGLRSMHRELIKKADLVVVGGTNMMNLRMWPFRGENRWKIPYEESRWLRDVVLFGVGWAGYRHKPNWFGVDFYKRVLSPSAFHSVRDEYTKRQLIEHGIPRVLYTSCPTTWNLTPDHMERIPEAKGRAVVTTLSHYSQSPFEDRAMLDVLRRLYDRVFFWPQGVSDIDYFDRLRIDDVEVVGPALAEFDAVLLEKDAIDYCGTRLHAGIRALQYGRRSLIISIDNRAHEISRDTELQVHGRGDIASLGARLDGRIAPRFKLPSAAIDAFRDSLRSGTYRQ